MYKVYVGYSDWRGGDYNGSYIGTGKDFFFKDLTKAERFVQEVNDGLRLKTLHNAQAYPPRPIETED